MVDVFLAEAAVDAVGDENEIGIGKTGLVVDVHLEMQDDAKLASALLKDQKQLASRTAAKPLPPTRCTVPRKCTAMSSQ